MNIRKDYYPDEIAAALCKLAVGDDEADKEKIPDCTNALYDLMAICENEYNSDYYRTFWDVLQDVAAVQERIDRHDKIKNKKEDKH